MELALVIALGAALIGVRRGGSLQALSNTRFRAPALVFVGLGLQLAFDLWSPEWLTKDMALALLLVSNTFVALFIALNQRLPGMLLIAVGLALNVAVIAANGAMPVSPEAAESSGATTSVDDTGGKHEALDEDTLLPWFADVIPVPGVRVVLSVGDLLLALGIGRLVYACTTSARRGERSRTASG